MAIFLLQQPPFALTRHPRRGSQRIHVPFGNLPNRTLYERLGSDGHPSRISTMRVHVFTILPYLTSWRCTTRPLAHLSRALGWGGTTASVWSSGCSLWRSWWPGSKPRRRMLARRSGSSNSRKRAQIPVADREICKSPSLSERRGVAVCSWLVPGRVADGRLAPSTTLTRERGGVGQGVSEAAQSFSSLFAMLRCVC